MLTWRKQIPVATTAQQDRQGKHQSILTYESEIRPARQKQIATTTQQDRPGERRRANTYIKRQIDLHNTPIGAF